ncbi:MAG: TCP-1/cpn60 chaperonin family protein, partial [Candidatus Nanoarchaeia archaeon]
DKVQAVIDTGANVLICQKGVDDLAQYFLAQKGIYTIRRVAKSDMEKIAKATGATLVNSWKELKKEHLGNAGVVEEVKVAEDEMTFIRDCKNPKAVTLLVKGGTEHVADEAKRAVEDSLGDLKATLETGKVVAGAGAVEIEVAIHLKKYAQSLSGKEQLAVESFANALEVIPRTLAESAGLDPIDKIAEMRAAHDKGNKWHGINVFSGKIMDAWKNKVLEPFKVKSLAINSSTEVAIMILRIDDVIQGGQQAPSQPGMM